MLRLRRVAPVILLTSALAGCASTQTVAVNQSALNQFRGATIVTSQRPMPLFVAQTAGKTAFGAFGLVGGAIEGVEVAKAGNALVRNDGLADPADAIEHQLLSDLVRDQGLKTVDSSVSTNSIDVATLAKQYDSADLLLDVQTTYWGFINFPVSLRHYKVLYYAKLRLIDTKHAKLLATALCERTPESSASSAPTYAELVADHGALLKKDLAEAVETCTERFRQNALLESTVASR